MIESPNSFQNESDFARGKRVGFIDLTKLLEDLGVSQSIFSGKCNLRSSKRAAMTSVQDGLSLGRRGLCEE
jgi:hypothetical protein